MASEKRLIDANRLVKIIQEAIEESDVKLFKDVMRKMYDALDSFPTVDVVEAVRCKDCKHNKPYKSFDGSMKNNCNHPRNGRMNLPSEHFCAYGERRD